MALPKVKEIQCLHKSQVANQELMTILMPKITISQEKKRMRLNKSKGMIKKKIQQRLVDIELCWRLLKKVKGMLMQEVQEEVVLKVQRKVLIKVQERVLAKVKREALLKVQEKVHLKVRLSKVDPRESLLIKVQTKFQDIRQC